MSKLFDQLKDAARDREGGILLDALARKQKADADARGGAPAQGELPLPEAAAARLPEELPPPSLERPPVGAPAETSSSKPREAAPPRSSLAGAALAAAIFLAVFFVWQAAPWRAPQKLKIEPDSLKLDRSLDLGRVPSKGTSSPSRPS